MLGGLALFLYGMRIMGDGLKKESTGSFKTALEKVTNNQFIGFLVGLGLTALIQSSTATIVIVAGLVGAGIMSLSQSIGVIIGANVGTTVTGQIIRLLDINANPNSILNLFKPDTLAPIAAVIGIVFVMFVNTRKSDTVGTIAMGFAILFTGLINMTAAVEPLSTDPEFTKIFFAFSDRPVLGFLVGFAVAFILQSSSATVGILQALSVTGALTFAAIYPMLIGIYLGDCVTTAIVCSIGTKADTKRTGMVNILYNLSGMILIVIVVNVLHSIGTIDGLWNQVLNSGGIANTHTVFKLASAIILLPLSGTYEKLAVKIVKDDKDSIKIPELQALDPALFASPALALNASYKAINRMHNMIAENLPLSVGLLKKFDDKVYKKIHDDEDVLDIIADEVSNYLADLSPHLTAGLQEAIQNYYLQCITDFERAGDHVMELAHCAEDAANKNIQFSDSAFKDMDTIMNLLENTLANTRLSFERQNVEAAKKVQPSCETITQLADNARSGHMKRMNQGECDAISGFVYQDELMHMVRVSDMCSNIALHTIARHSVEKTPEHAYVDMLRRGENQEYNEMLADLKKEYSLD